MTKDPSVFGLRDFGKESVGHTEAFDDDCGPPEDPVFSNYSKYLWRGHSENRRIRKNVRERVAPVGEREVS